MKTLAKDFDQFILTLPEEVRTKYRDEMEQAYHAGAATVYVWLMKDEPSVLQIDSLDTELTAFVDKMMKRVA